MKAQLSRFWRDLYDSVKGRDGKCKDCGCADDLHAYLVNKEQKKDKSGWITVCTPCRVKRYDEKRPVRIRSENPGKRLLAAKLAEVTKKLKEFQNGARRV